jgi:hypothetical protein
MESKYVISENSFVQPERKDNLGINETSFWGEGMEREDAGLRYIT